MENTSASRDSAPTTRTEPSERSTESSHRDDRGRWHRGVSGNTKGRPRSGLALAEAVRQHVAPELLISVAGAILQDKETPPNVRLAACEFLASRGYSKPSERIELSQGAPDVVDDFSDLDHAELLELEAIERRRAEILHRAKARATESGGPPALTAGPVLDA